MVVIGLEQQTGNIKDTDIAYNNILLYVSKNFKNDTYHLGYCVNQFKTFKDGKQINVPYLKVKYAVFKNILATLGLKNDSEILNKDVKFMFDEYSNVVGAFVDKEDE